MKVVITGALGHIGSHLIRDLPRRFPGMALELVDNMMTQRYPSLFDLPSLARFRFHEADVTAMDLAPLVDGAEAVIHLAAVTDATRSFERKELVEENNYHATVRVAEVCAAAGVPLIHLSSTSVYGSQARRVDEDCSELVPQSPYAETKLREEALIQDMAGRGLPAVILRFGTIFGASVGMRFHTAVNRFCWQAVLGQPLSVWRTAYDQKRPYLDLIDAGRAIAFLLERRHFDGRVYNVLTLNATVRQIVDHIRARVPDLEVGFVDTRIMNQLSYEVDRSRFEALGFAFRGDIARGIADTVGHLAALKR